MERRECQLMKDYFDDYKIGVNDPTISRLMQEPAIRVRTEDQMVATIHLAKLGYHGRIIVKNQSILNCLFYNVPDDFSFTHQVLELE